MCFLKCDDCLIKKNKNVFQIHVTVENISETAFKKLCENLSLQFLVKPIIVAYENGKHHMMTNTHTDTLENAFHALEHIYSYFFFRNVDIVREKIETVPWTDENVKYYETHISTTKDLELNKSFGYSRNINKSTDIYTKRYKNKEEGDKFIEFIKNYDNSCEVITEAIIYDSNSEYDNNWLETV